MFKRLLIVLSITLYFVLGLYAAEGKDIVRLKSGEMLMGTIIENVPGEHVIIQFGASSITIDCNQISLITKESSKNPYGETLKPKKQFPVYFKLGASYFKPAYTGNGLYDRFVVPAIGGGVRLKKNFAVELTGEIYSRAKDENDFVHFPELVELHMESVNYIIVPITTTAIYKWQPTPDDLFIPYLGFGTGYYFVQEYFQGNDGYKTNMDGVGIHFLIGVQYKWMQIESKLAIAPVSSNDVSDDEGTINAGGISLSIGIRL